VIGAVFAVHAVAAAGLAILGADDFGVAVGYERVEVMIDTQNNVATPATVAATQNAAPIVVTWLGVIPIRAASRVSTSAHSGHKYLVRMSVTPL